MRFEFEFGPSEAAQMGCVLVPQRRSTGPGVADDGRTSMETGTGALWRSAKLRKAVTLTSTSHDGPRLRHPRLDLSHYSEHQLSDSKAAKVREKTRRSKGSEKGLDCGYML